MENNRLSMLSEENPYVFTGTPKKISIISNGSCYGPCPKTEEQHITLNFDGHVWYSGYTFGEVYVKHEKTHTKNYKIEKEIAEHVLNKVAAYFSNDYDKIFTADVGSWEMEITNTEGKVYMFNGSLYSHFEVDGVDLSDLIRDSLEIDDLYVFDGRFKPDTINKIMVDYHRVTKMKPMQLISEKMNMLLWTIQNN